MVKKILALMVISLLSVGCVKKVYVPVPQEVKVVVPAECPQPPYLPEPILPVGGVTPTTSDPDTARAYVLTIEQLKQEIKKRDKLLDAYRQKFGKIEEGQPTP